MRSIFRFILIFLLTGQALAQEPVEEEVKQINIVYGANFTKDEVQFPGASIFSKDDRQIQFEHEGADLFCDIAIYYQKDNKLKAVGNIRLQQGDSIQMTSGKIDYDGNENLAKAWENVILTSNSQMTLTTDTLHFNRIQQQAYYQDFGTVVDSVNTLTSEVGKYFLETKKLQFLDSVHLKNPDYILDSEQLDYYETSKNAYLYGPSTITSDTYKIYCERGFYDTKVESGYFIKKTRIDYNNRIIKGDSVYFNKVREFASATNNIKVIDTVNNGVIKAHYAEVFKAKDSVFATKRAVSISLMEQDSLYMHGDTLMVTGKPDHRILRAFRNAKFFKTDISGKCDSIHTDQKTGITQLITNPILWNGPNQMTGDSIHLKSDLKTEKMDSLKVLNNAFIISLDSVSMEGYNQAKGKDLFGKFKDNQLKVIDLIKNTEVIYYMYNDDDELIGIDKTICSAIRITMANNDIEDLTFFTNPDGDIYPETELPENSRKLKGFIWRGDERILTKDDIFDEDDNNLILPVIRGINNPIDIEMENSSTENEIRIPDSKKESKVDKIAQQKRVKPTNNTETKERYEEVPIEDDIRSGYYLIAKVYKDKVNYKKFIKSLNSQGLQPNHFYRSFNKFYYVYLDRYDTLDNAKKARDSRFSGHYQDSTWIFRVLDK